MPFRIGPFSRLRERFPRREFLYHSPWSLSRRNLFAGRNSFPAGYFKRIHRVPTGLGDGLKRGFVQSTDQFIPTIIVYEHHK